MKNITTLFCFFLQFSTCYSQSIQFSQIPQDRQFFARDQSDSATVVFNGIINDLNINSVSLNIKKGNTFYKHLSKVKNTTGQTNFTFAIRIKAELASYNFVFYIHSTNDSTIYRSVNEIVAGDAFIIHGQSNADGGYYPPVNPTYLRTFGIKTSNGNYDSYNLADTLWRTDFPLVYIGSIGMHVAKKLQEIKNIPICIINGAAPGSGIDIFISTSSNLSSYYQNHLSGKLTYRVLKSGLVGKIKGIIWWHGESAINNNYTPNDYKTGFQSLYNIWTNDLGYIPKIYVIQLNIMSTSVNFAGQIRDIQRNFQYNFPNIRTIATTGTTSFDGVHYGEAGYIEVAQSIVENILKDNYLENLSEDIHSPSIRSAFYTNPYKNKIKLKFEPNTNIVWSDTTINNEIRYLKDYLYLNDGSLIVNASANKDSIILELNTAPSNATQISYLPANYGTGGSDVFKGPYIKNHLYRKALTFDSFPIGDYISSPLLLDNTNDNKVLDLIWTAVSTDPTINYLIERSINSINNFQQINQTVNLSLQESLPQSASILYYRVKAKTRTSESEFSNIIQVQVCPNHLITASVVPNYFSLFAQKSIVLLPGFLVNQNTVFKASIETCN